MSRGEAGAPREPAGGLFISVVVHGALLALTVLVVVSRYFKPEEETVFVAQPRVLVPLRWQRPRQRRACWARAPRQTRARCAWGAR